MHDAGDYVNLIRSPNYLRNMGLGSSTTGQLSKGELERVHSSWKVVMENPEENGVFIFKTFLDKYNYYGYFKKFDGVPIEELPKNKIFRKHALSIIQAINNITLHIGNDSILKHDLNSLGKMHRVRTITEQQFEELKAVILDVLEKVFNLPVETLNAWNKTLDIAFLYIFEGLKEEH